MNTLVHFVLRQSCSILRIVSLGSLHVPFLVFIKRSYLGWLSLYPAPALQADKSTDLEAYSQQIAVKNLL